jgi:hypothetical protein
MQMSSFSNSNRYMEVTMIEVKAQEFDKAKEYFLHLYINPPNLP